jgi:Family of unknown function (DUF6364)
MSRLTLSIDHRVIERAKKYAARHGRSVSQLVEEYLDRLSRPPTYSPLWHGRAKERSSKRQYLCRQRPFSGPLHAIISTDGESLASPFLLR